MNIGKISNINLNRDTAYLAGVIVGDGYISNSTKSKTDLSKDYRISIELIDKESLTVIVDMIKKIVTTKSEIKSRNRKSKKVKHYYFLLRNKSFYYFLTDKLEIPSGKKSHRVLYQI